MHEQLPCYKTHFWPLHIMSHTCLAILFYVVGHDQPVYAMRLIKQIACSVLNMQHLHCGTF